MRWRRGMGAGPNGCSGRCALGAPRRRPPRTTTVCDDHGRLVVVGAPHRSRPPAGAVGGTPVMILAVESATELGRVAWPTRRAVARHRHGATGPPSPPSPSPPPSNSSVRAGVGLVALDAGGVDVAPALHGAAGRRRAAKAWPSPGPAARRRRQLEVLAQAVARRVWRRARSWFPSSTPAGRGSSWAPAGDRNRVSWEERETRGTPDRSPPSSRGGGAVRTGGNGARGTLGDTGRRPRLLVMRAETLDSLSRRCWHVGAGQALAAGRPVTRPP